MQAFKRNQVEQAIVRTLGTSEERVRDLKLKLKLKRLLVADRQLGRAKRSAGRADRRYAFYSAKPMGSGVEVMFSNYEAFALMMALIVLEHGIPQAKVVSILQQIRPDLEAAHRETLQKDPKDLFDREEVRARALPGQIAVDNTAPVFLTFVKINIGKGRIHATISVCHGLEELAKFFKEHSLPGSGATHFELVRLMHALADNLSKTRPIKRGRSTI
jgi:hypothetical protein